jgi:uncharacterized protein (DUF1501 family)
MPDPSRRDFLRVGTLSLGGFTLSQLLALRRAAAGESFVRDKSVVLLYLSGGASHIETFDPKMTSPEGTRSLTGEVQTNLPGVTFGGTFPQLARLADRLAVVRSFTHGIGDHVDAHAHVLSGGLDPSGKRMQGFSMGSMATRLRGANSDRTGLPNYILLTEKEVDGQYNNERSRFLNGSWPGKLGPSYVGMQHEVGWDATKKASESKASRKPRAPGPNENPLLANMELNLPEEVLNDRLKLLGEFDRLDRQLDRSGEMEAVDKFGAQALQLVLGAGRDAFDLSHEDPRVVERYDTSAIRIGHKVFRPSTLGKQLLVARRLCEAGCGFVSVHSAGWDMHADGNNPPIGRGMEMLGRSLDQAVSAFLEDLEQRGLSEQVLLVITGDFGRTPKVNRNGGRDHWTRLCTLAFAGGGLRMGQVVGQSARNADVPATTPIRPENLLGTIVHTLFDVGKLRLATGVPEDLLRAATQCEPIAELVG